MLSSRLQLLRESLQKLLRRSADSHVERLLSRSRAADIAVVMRELGESQRARVFDLISGNEPKAEVLAELDDHLVAELLNARPLNELIFIVSEMNADDQADLLALLPQSQRDALIDALQPSDAEEVKELLHYDPDSAGGIMSTDFFALGASTTAAEAIERLQSSEDVEMAFYIYVIDAAEHLVGVASLRALVTNPPNTPLSEVMVRDVISAFTGTDQEEVASLAARYNLLAIPVVDSANHLVGIVTIDDVIDVIREEATEDILKMAGADETALESHSLLKNMRIRAPWLLATWVGGLGASVLIGVFEEQLSRTVALAAFIPIVLGMGGNVGTQTATIIVRGIATGRVSEGMGLRFLIRETSVGVLLGLLYGVLLGAYAILAYSGAAHSVELALTVAISILASMAMSASVGALTPLIFSRIRIDPAVATGPIVTTTVDVLGILVYFLAADLLLGTV